VYERLAAQVTRDDVTVEDIPRYLRIIDLLFQMLQETVHVCIALNAGGIGIVIVGCDVQCRKVFG
jgi:hypothetical protein